MTDKKRHTRGIHHRGGVEVPESALRTGGQEQQGTAACRALSDDELASPAELERQVALAEWGPILALPCEARDGGFHPDIDECGHLDGAFGTVDFERLYPSFDKASTKPTSSGAPAVGAHHARHGAGAIVVAGQVGGLGPYPLRGGPGRLRRHERVRIRPLVSSSAKPSQPDS